MPNRTVALKPTPEQQAEIRGLLRALPASVTCQVYGPPGYRVRGWAGTPLHLVDVLIRTREDAARLARELPAHLALPPVWSAPRPPDASIAWAAGYMAVKRHCLPVAGLFLPAKQVDLNALSQVYPDGSADQAAFFLGARAYLGSFWTALSTSAPATLRAS
ncbi:hypothetical protein [Deinococcus multiflagellatus]|nr:hypothetical protein [Deinococcus multiflagellatus]MBZ9715604.1 hypothetical protein [Deinococcus multiflagellatus]